MRLSDLRDLRVKTSDGETLGRVHEVHCEGGRVVALSFGAGSFIERLTSKSNGRRIPWDRVARLDRKALYLTDEPPASKPSAARNRKGIPRPTGPRSKR